MNIQKFILTILLVSVFTISKADINLQTTDVTAVPGTDFTIPIIIYGAGEDGTPISSANIVFTFDTTNVKFLQFLNFNPLTPQNQWFFSGNNNTGIVAANWLEPNLGTVAIPEGSTLYQVKFKAKPGACPFSFITYEFTDADYNTVPATADNGSYASLQQVTFKVNMRDQVVSPQGVFLAGSFNGWSTTSTQMTAGDSTIYSATVQLVSDSLYYYRYVNGNNSSGYETVPAECGTMANGAYSRSVINPGGDVALPDMCFSSCVACPPLSIATFQVDMRDQFVGAGGVHLAGSFNGWSTSETPMTLSYSAVYTVNLALLSDSSYTYKFVNGNSTSGYETVPVACGVPYGNDYARSLILPIQDTVLSKVCFSECDTCLPRVNITFRVDMSEQNVSPNGVHIAGTFNNWNPAGTLMSNLGSDIFGVTIPIVPGTDVEYRFVNGNTTGNYEIVPPNCGVPAEGGLFNRFSATPEMDSTLMAVCFSNCSECLTLRSITFKVDMRQEDISPDGIHLAGSFNGFNPSSVSMTNQGNDVFFAAVDLLEGDHITFRFVNGNNASGFEVVPAECGEENGSGIYNRFITVPEGNATLDEVCFSECADCEQQPYEKDVTFRVDMNKQEISTDGVHLAGTFNNWDPAGIQMILIGNNVYSVTKTLNENDDHQYRFVNGNSSGDYETVPAGCGFEGLSGGLERQIIVPSGDTTLDAVCFSECQVCQTYQVALNVDMMFQNVSVHGVHLACSINNWNTGDIEMASAGSSIYEITLQVYEGDTLSYRFVNGNQNGDMETVPADCGWLYNGLDYARKIIPVGDTIIQEVCYSTCGQCNVGYDEKQNLPLIGFPYPNPAQTSLKIPLHLPGDSQVSLELISILGGHKEFREFSLNEGYQEIETDLNQFPAGFIVVRIIINSDGNSFQQSSKLLIIR
jgi:hypothetical protein